MGLLAGQGPGTLRRTHSEQSVPQGLHAMEEGHAEAVTEELQPAGRTCFRNSWRIVSCGRDPTGAVEEFKESSSQERRSSRDNVW